MPSTHLARSSLTLFVLLVVGSASAGSSQSYEIEGATLDAGGVPPGTVLASSAYRITLAAIGDPLSQTIAPSSPGHRSDSGFVSAYPPPAEVAGLVLVDKDLLAWNPARSATFYSLYRGTAGDMASGGATCEQSAILSVTASDPSTPTPGETYFYLVSAHNTLGEESSVGQNSSGAQRTPAACP